MVQASDRISVDAVPAEVDEIRAIQAGNRTDRESEMAACERLFPGEIERILSEQGPFIALLVRNHYHQTARVHGYTEVLHESTVGAARGIAGWLLNDAEEKPTVRGYIRNAIKFHLKEQFRGLSGCITHAFCKKNDPKNPTPLAARMIRVAVVSMSAAPASGGMFLQVSDRSETESDAMERAEENAGRIRTIRETAAMMDFTGITTWICDCLAAGKSHRAIGDMLGISKTRISNVVDELRKYVTGESRNRNAIRWNQSTVDTFLSLNVAAA